MSQNKINLCSPVVHRFELLGELGPGRLVLGLHGPLHVQADGLLQGHGVVVGLVGQAAGEVGEVLGDLLDLGQEVVEGVGRGGGELLHVLQGVEDLAGDAVVLADLLWGVTESFFSIESTLTTS